MKKILKPFKSNLKLTYNSDLGMWQITGKSLTRITSDLIFYDKTAASSFKYDLDRQDFYVYHDSILNENG